MARTELPWRVWGRSNGHAARVTAADNVNNL